ncbi:ribonuclease H-like domain-containing protein [Tanacetum coccineum]
MSRDFTKSRKNPKIEYSNARTPQQNRVAERKNRTLIEAARTMLADLFLPNNVKYITAKVAGKPVSISEASIRSDLLFDDADGIDSLPNQAIFDVIQLIGYKGDLTVLTFNKALFSLQWRFLF